MAAFLCAAIIFAGCTTASNTASNTATANKTNTASANTSTPAANTSNTANTSNSSAKSETAPAGDSVGVAECDEYIKKYEACLTKVAAKAPQAEAPLKTAFQAQRDSFKTGASTPQGKTALVTVCKNALDAAKKNAALTAYACEW